MTPPAGARSAEQPRSEPRRPLGIEERDFALWLGRVEARAILPMKWAMLVVCALYWTWVRDWQAPSTSAFSVFFLYGAVTAALQWFFWRDRVALHQVRPLAMLSYVADLAFVTALILADERDPALDLLRVAPGSDFYILYLLMILRGFALFRTPLENTIAAALISILFLLSMAWNADSLMPLSSKGVILRLALLWSTMLMATFIVNIVSRQQGEMLRVRERLVKSEGFAALGELAAGVAHEINNPIGIIKTYSEYLKKSAGPDDPHFEDFDIMQREAERCETIVRRLMDFANPNVRSFDVLDVAAIARETIDFVFHEKAGSPVKCHLQVEGRIPPVRGDQVMLRQALLNVILNARQVLSEEDHAGEITVRLRQMPGPRAPIEISVHDNGRGISPEDAERAFEPFFTRREGGTGLGLAITRRIVEAHEGSIAIWPAGGGGTTCAITLPIADDPE